MPDYNTGCKVEKINGMVSIFYKDNQNSEWKEAEHGFINKLPTLYFIHVYKFC